MFRFLEDVSVIGLFEESQIENIQTKFGSIFFLFRDDFRKGKRLIIGW